MNHGILDVFAYQEALLIEVAFGIAIMTMTWIGFRRWLQHKDRIVRVIAEQSAERTAQYGASFALVEDRLKAIEQILTDRLVCSGGQIDAPETEPLPSGEVHRVR